MALLEPSAEYKGPRPGFVYKNGDQGLGYYRDMKGVVPGGPGGLIEEEPIQPRVAVPFPVRIPEYFEPCSTFRGPIEGWVFQKGERGTGYYRDDPAVRRQMRLEIRQRERRARRQVAIPGYFDPCAVFLGTREGWVFKMGDLGLGYYRDAECQPERPMDEEQEPQEGQQEEDQEGQEEEDEEEEENWPGHRVAVIRSPTKSQSNTKSQPKPSKFEGCVIC